MNTVTAAAAAAAAGLPFAWAPNMPGCRIVGEPRSADQLHARATELATAAMNSATSTEGEVLAFRAKVQAEDEAIRVANLRAHEARNAAAHEAALARKATRMNVHVMRNAEARAEAAARKADRMAAHEARVEASRKVA
ncbi:hypothetical protein [Sphingomonas sp. 3-13AW]|uniref:hypothetical protein n=1 Tax=Sphingomonas sp. 3-13AW TaxID=3050450 RepID=UPI003BB4F049